MSRRLRAFLHKTVRSAAIFFIITAPQSRAFQVAESGKAPYPAVRIDVPIRMTGKLDDPSWRRSHRVELVYEMQPGENTRPSQQTFIRILYNSESIYFGFDCRDTRPSEIRAHVTDRDKMFDDDYIIVLFDTYADHQKTYEFFVNPFGIQGDILRTGNDEDASFDLVWYSAAAINDSGWTAEIAIPFKSLRFPSRQEQVWTLMLGRNYPRDSRYVFSWTTFDRNNPCFICQGMPLTGIRDIESTSSVEILPYVIATQRGAVTDADDPASEFTNGKVQGRAGGGIKYSPSPDFSVDAVFNPDFSQVESDAAQISVNTTFALSYPEKRPFFLQGLDLFQVESDLVYSRSINNPYAAAKVVGKTGALSYAYLAASDRNTAFIIPGEEESDLVRTGLESFVNLARARYEFGDESFLGALATTRNVSAGHNYVGGVDWKYKFWENYYFRGELFYALTQELNDTLLFNEPRPFGSGQSARLDGESYGGGSYQVDISRQARDYSFSLNYREEAPTFQAYVGRVNSNDTRTLRMEHEYAIYPNNAFMDKGTAIVEGGLHYNQRGVKKEQWMFTGLNLELKGQTSLSIEYLLVNDELFHGVMFEHVNRASIELESKPLSSLSFFVEVNTGRFIRRSDTPALGTGHEISFESTIKPTPQAQVELSFERARLSDVGTGELFYDGYITRGVGIYQFTAELFVRLIAQYDSFDKTMDFYPLLSYKLNPFTIFYAGLTSTMQDYGEPTGFKQTARQVFVKLQYLWRS